MVQSMHVIYPIKPKILVGVGGGMEPSVCLFLQAKSGVIGADVVDEMLEASKRNFFEAYKTIGLTLVLLISEKETPSTYPSTIIR